MSTQQQLIPIFNGDRYDYWYIKMKTIFQSQDLWDCIESGYEESESTADLTVAQMELLKKNRKRNAKALAFIQQAITDDLFSRIMEAITAKEAWDILRKEFQGDKKPCRAMEDGSSEIAAERGVRIKYIELYWALVDGDLERVKEFLDNDPEAINSQISTTGETPIHIAVSHGHEELVEFLLSSIGMLNDSGIRDGYGDTPLHIAARGGNRKIANALVHHSPSLLGSVDADGQFPLTVAAVFGTVAAVFGNWEMMCFLEFLLDEFGMDTVMRGNSDGHDPKWNIFTKFIKSNNFGFAQMIWSKQEPELMIFKDGLFTMAEMVSVFSSANQLTIFERLISNRKCMCVLYASLKANVALSTVLGSAFSRNSKVSRFLLSVLTAIGIGKILKMRVKNFQAHELLSKMCSPIWTFDPDHVGVYFEAIKRAIKCGNAEFVEEVLRSNPALIWGNTKESGSIFHIALAFRQERIWNLIYGLTTEHRNKITGTLLESNSLLHVAACPTLMPKTIGIPEKIFGKARDAAMKVQRELQWYKEVERMVPSFHILLANENREIPSDLFSKYHHKLVKEGEQWMRDTAGSFTIVAALIVTVMFAAAFTLPGGTDDDSGNPKLLQHNSFLIFIISDAISLFSSVTAVSMFLSILTSRCTMEDFLNSLPKRLIIGLATLFLSIATMMVAFVATLVIVLGERIRMAVAPITLLASVPVASFVLLQLPLFVDMVSSTYGRSIFNRKTKCSFFKNPNKYVPPNHGYFCDV